MNRQMQYLLINELGKDENGKSRLDDELNFLIDTNYVAMIDGGRLDIECRKALKNFLFAKGFKPRRIDENWSMISSRLMPANATTEQLLTFLENDLYYHTRKHMFEFSASEGTFFDLTEPVTLSKDIYPDRDFFSYFFAYRLFRRDFERTLDFLKYNLVTQFKGDLGMFALFLKMSILPKYSELIGSDKCLLLRDIISAYDKEENHGSAEITSKQHAIILYILLETKEMAIIGTKRSFLRQYASKINIGVGKFPSQYYSIEKIFREKSYTQTFLDDLTEVLPHLKDPQKNWAQLKIVEIRNVVA